MAKAKDHRTLEEYLPQLPGGGWMSKIKTEQNQVNASFLPHVNFSNYSLKCKRPGLTFQHHQSVDQDYQSVNEIK